MTKRTLANTIEQLGTISGKIHYPLKIILVVAAVAAPVTGYYFSGRYGLFLGCTIMLGLSGWAALFNMLSGGTTKKN